MKYFDTIFETLAENWDEKHCVAWGILFVLLPWLWFEIDENGIPRRWTEDTKRIILNDPHYYYAGQALMFCIIVIIIFFLFGLYCIL